MFIPKFRFTFYKIPFMRGGVDVPIVAVPGAQVTELEKYFVAEIISEKQFSETQNQIVLANAASVNNANYVRIARTTASQTQSNYDLDTDPAFFWVEDVQIICTAKDTDGPQSAIITISPDPWLTDFCDASSDVNLRGRLKQSTKKQYGERISPPIEPVTDFSQLNFTDISETSAADSLFCAVGVITTSGGSIMILASKNGQKRIDTYPNGISTHVYDFSRTAFYRYSLAPEELKESATCIKILVLPNSWIEWAKQGQDVILTSVSGAELLTTQIEIESDFRLYYAMSVGMPGGFYPKYNYFLVTPSRIIRLENAPHVLTLSAVQKFGHIYIGVPYGFSSDGIAIFLDVEGEIIDITDDFQADFAINDQALKQAQQKENTTLSVMTGVIGGIGGVVGGVASGNYFGAIQSALGGASAIMAPTAARKTPAMLKGSGNVMTAIYGQGILAIANTYQISNEDAYNKALSQFGYIYPNKPYVELNDYNEIKKEFYAFEEVDVTGITGGQASAIEIAADLIRGVNLKVI